MVQPNHAIEYSNTIHLMVEKDAIGTLNGTQLGWNMMQLDQQFWMQTAHLSTKIFPIETILFGRQSVHA